MGDQIGPLIHSTGPSVSAQRSIERGPGRNPLALGLISRVLAALAAVLPADLCRCLFYEHVTCSLMTSTDQRGKRIRVPPRCGPFPPLRQRPRWSCLILPVGILTGGPKKKKTVTKRLLTAPGFQESTQRSRQKCVFYILFTGTYSIKQRGTGSSGGALGWWEGDGGKRRPGDKEGPF